MYLDFIPFYGWITLHYMDGPHFVSPFVHWWRSGLFHLSAIVNNTAMNIHIVEIFAQTYVFVSVGYIRRQGITGWSLLIMCKDLRKGHAACAQWLHHVTSSQVCMRIQCVFYAFLCKPVCGLQKLNPSPPRGPLHTLPFLFLKHFSCIIPQCGCPPSVVISQLEWDLHIPGPWI